MDLERTIAPTTAEILALVPVERVRRELRISHRLEDDLIQDKILDAFSYFDGPDGWLRRAILPQKWTYYLSAFQDVLLLPVSPLRSVDEVAYRDDNGTWQVVPSATYEVVTGELFGSVVPVLDGSWPDAPERSRAVRVKFTAGWTLDTVPGGVTRAIKLMTGSLHQHREADMEDNRVSSVSRKIEYGIERLAGRFKIRNDAIDVFSGDDA